MTAAAKASFLVIDPFTPTISRLDYPATAAETLPILYAAIQCDLVDCVCLGETLDGQRLDLWIDDEGLFKAGQQSFAILDEEGKPIQVIAGRAVVAASNSEGETIGLADPVAEFERLRARIGFPVSSPAAE